MVAETPQLRAAQRDLDAKTALVRDGIDPGFRLQREWRRHCARPSRVRKVFAEKVSGRSTRDREQLALALDFVRDGDTLVVTRLDRLARSVADLHRIIERLTEKKVAFRCLNQSGVDTDTSTGRLMLAVLGAVAAFENDIRRERQLEGIEKAKLRGAYRGRPATISPDAVRRLRDEGLGATEIAKALNIGGASVYRVLSA